MAESSLPTPSLLFFSGGTAINPLSRALARRTDETTYLVTTFDSGGSSAPLRKAFHMPAIGDLRSRLIAVANDTNPATRAVTDLLGHRLPGTGEKASLIHELDQILTGRHPLCEPLPDAEANWIRRRLERVLRALPDTFDFHHASIGNLVLAGDYLNEQGDLGKAIEIFSAHVQSRAQVLPIVTEALHLCVQLNDGTRVCSQRQITGKECPPLQVPISAIELSRSETRREPVRPRIAPSTAQLIRTARCICYPPGSFYTSLIANFLPEGVGRAIADNPCAKFYLPNRGIDPEQLGHSFRMLIQRLLYYTGQDGHIKPAANSLLTAVVLDHHQPLPPGDEQWLKNQGIDVIRFKLVSDASAPWYDPERLADCLLTLSA